MASSFTVLADLKAVCCLKTGRCSTSAEIRLLRFLRLFNRDDVDLFGIDDAVAKLGVERWRIYDVVNILESVGVLSRKGKSLYSWKGRTFERGFWHLEYLQQFPQVLWKMYIRYHFTPLTYSHETALDSGQMYELCIDFSIHLRVSYIGADKQILSSLKYADFPKLYYRRPQRTQGDV
ncbi:hypothetical protein DY000_02006948 [Brassica cretica]|uniref:E2F/DP family winged-helix DNA-binding domain-containing protein n=1 Tax=Brassica cretica TaxID=69181 RepID=A0ABQ7BWB4_BRACR|nr:hypothetical protein DY000_02006948 [Brassica cretica]